MREKHIYTVSQLTRNIREILEARFTDIWVEGEVSNLRQPSSGHIYFTLKDADGQLRCVMFRGVNRHLKFKLEDGLQIILHGQISVYEKRGDYQLIAEVAEPKGRGALQLAFEQLKKKLEEEGLFRADLKKGIPLLPCSIGVVTSPTGAAIRDILNVLERRFPNVRVLLNPARVQGEGAAEEIAQAIEELDRIGQMDVIIVGRGGGSVEDLWAFNEEVIARCIYRCKTPVISAVGHEIDYTICDFAADVRAPTPSAAAELAIGDRNSLQEKVRTAAERLLYCAGNIISRAKGELSRLNNSLSPRYLLQKIRQHQQTTDEYLEKMEMSLRHSVELRKSELKGISGKLSSINPFAILNRGYSISFKLPERTLLKSACQVEAGDLIEVKLSQGGFVSEIKERRQDD